MSTRTNERGSGAVGAVGGGGASSHADTTTSATDAIRRTNGRTGTSRGSRQGDFRLAQPLCKMVQSGPDEADREGPEGGREAGAGTGDPVVLDFPALVRSARRLRRLVDPAADR